MSTHVVETHAGLVRGAEIAEDVIGWRGIPYAAPPVGALRLRAPEPPAPWRGERDATAYAAPSLQPPNEFAAAASGAFGAAAAPVLPDPSEDCLYLNVSAPAGAAGLPVLVWLHGGGYQSGSGTDIAGDGAEFARNHSVVVVTLNYRLGALGFLAVAGEAHSGAFGLHDQIAALRWVRDNIAGFGGDPSRVTVYGLSAGAKSVANLMASPLARGLFHGAASSSGGGDHVATPAQAAAVATRLLRELDIKPERIREAGAAEILAAQSAIGPGPRTTWMWRPAIDGSALTARPLDAVAAGAAAGIPLLVQTCVNECTLYQLLDPKAGAQAERVLSGYFGDAGRDEILGAYREARPDLAGDPVRLGVEVMTDERYVIPTIRLADAHSAHAPVWRSRYDVALTGLPPAIARSGRLPALHGTDGAPVWNGGAGVAGELHRAWGVFVTSGSPHAAGATGWPGYRTDRRSTLLFDIQGPRLVEDPDARRRRAWDGRDWQSGTWWSIEGLDF
jgi:para-nitrobenzyl esterase